MKDIMFLARILFMFLTVTPFAEIVDDLSSRLHESMDRFQLLKKDTLIASKFFRSMDSIILRADTIISLNNKCAAFDISSVPDPACKQLITIVPKLLSGYQILSAEIISFKLDQINLINDRTHKINQCADQLSQLIVVNDDNLKNLNYNLASQMDIALGGKTINVILSVTRDTTWRYNEYRLRRVFGEWTSACGKAIAITGSHEVNPEFLRVSNQALTKTPYLVMNAGNQLFVFATKYYIDEVSIRQGASKTHLLNIMTKDTKYLRDYNGNSQIYGSFSDVFHPIITFSWINDEYSVYKIELTENGYDPIIYDGISTLGIPSGYYKISVTHRSDSVSIPKNKFIEHWGFRGEYVNYLRNYPGNI